MEQPIFRSADKAVQAMWPALAALAGLLAWGAIWLAHITVALLVIAGCWWGGLTPEVLARALRDLPGSTTLATLGALGVSATTALAAWTWLMTRLHHWLVGRIAQHAMPD